MKNFKLNKVNGTANAAFDTESRAAVDQNISAVKKQNRLAVLDEGSDMEYVNLRAADRAVYKRNDNTKRTVIYSAPEFYKDENGNFTEISNKLCYDGENIVNKDNSFKVKFNKSAADGKVFDLQKDDCVLSLYAAGSSAKKAHACGCRCELCASAENKVVAHCGDGTEIEYVTLNDRIKENIIINEKQAAYEYEFTLKIGDLTVEEGENNNLLLKNAATDKTEFIIPAPFMYDAKGVHSNGVVYEIDVADGELKFKVVANAEFINAAERAFPVTIDPQIILSGDGVFSFVSEYYVQGNEDSDFFEWELVADASFGGVSSEVAHVTVHKNNVYGVDYEKYPKVSLQLTAKPGAKGYFMVNKEVYVAKEKVYEIDITDLYNNNNGDFTFGIYGHVSQSNRSSYIEFYTTDINAPKLIFSTVEYVLDEQSDVPLIKEIPLGKKATGYMNLNDGTLTAAVEALNLSDFALPLNILNIENLELEAGNYVAKWRLNLNKKLEVAKDDTALNTRYTYTDELFNKYSFTEKYYYITDNERKPVEKDKVTIDINGNLSYNNMPVYKHQSCNGYTLLPEINDFVNSDLIEQRQNEQINLEEFVNSYAVSLKSYVIYDLSQKTKTSSIENLTKEEYLSFIDEVNESSSCIVLTESDQYLLHSKIKDAKFVFSENKNEVVIKEGESAKEDDQSVIDNVNLMIKQARDNFPLVKYAFEKYFKKKAELDLLLLQIPKNFLKDENGIISGFNANGNLVYMCDSFGNYVSVEYESLNKISGLYDSNNKAVKFEYENGLLHSIKDDSGKTVKYGYDDKSRLSSITYADGSTMTFGYKNEILSSIQSSDGHRAELAYNDKKLSRVRVIHMGTNENTVSDLQIDRNGSNVTFSYLDGSEEKYEFYSNNKLKTYWQKDNTGLKKTTSYSYANNDGKEVTEVTEYNTKKQTEKCVKQYNELGLLTSQTNDWYNLSDSVKLKTVTEYEYDLDNNPVKETTVKSIDKNGVVTEEKSIVNSYFNAAGQLTLTESYTEGEEDTAGKNIEQRVYDENGNLAKTISWNSLDSSTKFYSEKEYSEKGKVLAEKDETGETSAEYEYIGGANAANSVKYPNGSKLAYGRNALTGEVTSVTQSTAEGESNTTDRAYQNGNLVKVKSGNTEIEYTYDFKGRKATVNVNGALQIKYDNNDKYKLEASGNATYAKNKQTYYADGKSYQFTYEKTGAPAADGKMEVDETYSAGSKILYANKYNTDGQLLRQTYACGAASKTCLYAYDKYGRITQAQTSENDTVTQTESYAYDEYGQLAQKSIEGAVNQTYSYTYKQNSARDLNCISYGEDYGFYPQKDVNGRNTGKEIYKTGAGVVASEHISYRKVGDHATNMPSAVWFGNGSEIKENLKYTYDRCGNIIKITQNGDTLVRYAYDDLNRLVREDNKPLNKTVLYSYDTCGNIVSRCEYAYTTKTGEELEALVCTHYNYAYTGDKLTAYNGKNFSYNNLGNPDIYKGVTLKWQYGKQLIQYGNITFTYDGLGRRIGKNTTKFIYDNDNKLIAQDNIKFIYDDKGLVGLEYLDNIYFYRKDVQGNIIAILDNTGNVVVKYMYDAWGGHRVLDASNKLITDGNSVGMVNPFRYRGYYYDCETALYYLQTRYYDPEARRFISQDDIDYADPETINGLNLYAYCGNNPVMYVDPNGNFLIAFLLAILAGALIGGVAGGLSAVANGDDFWGGFLSGALVGGVLGGIMVLGGATALVLAGKVVKGFIVVTSIAAKAGLFVGMATASFALSMGAGMGAYAITESRNNRPIYLDEMFRQGFFTGLKGLISFGTGMALAAAGAYTNLLVSEKLPFLESVKRSLDLWVHFGIPRTVASFAIQTPWRLFLK